MGRLSRLVDDSPVSHTEFQQLQAQLAANIKAARNACGLSQEALADAAEIDRTYVSQLERGLVNPSLGVLVRVANALDTDALILLAKFSNSPQGLY